MTGGAAVWPHPLRPDLPRHTIPAGTHLTRIHKPAPPGSPEPFFGPAPGRPAAQRFHDPSGEFRVCFLGCDDAAAFVEVFLRDPPIRFITVAELATRELSVLRLTRDIVLACLWGKGLAPLGCTAEITSSAEPYIMPQALSRAVWSHASIVDGIYCACRHDHSRFAVALYDRAAPALALVSTERLIRNRGRLLAFAKQYRLIIAA